MLKEGGFIKEVQCKHPPVYFTHYKLQKGLRNGLNLHALNYRLARPEIPLKGSARQDGKIGSHCGNWWVLWQWPTSFDSHLPSPVACTHPTLSDQNVTSPLSECTPSPRNRFVLMLPSLDPGVIPIIFHASVQLFTFYWWQCERTNQRWHIHLRVRRKTSA